MHEELLQKYKDQLMAVNDAMLEAVVSGVVEFSIDTGQSNQKAKKYELSDLQALETHIENKIGKLESKMNGNIVYLRTL
jgi:hypothetical protein